MAKQVHKHKSWRFRSFLKANEAVSALEYAVLVGIIAVAVGAAMVTFGDSIEAAIATLGGKLEAGATATGNVDLDG